MIALSFKEWKKIFWFIGLLATSYFIGITSVFYAGLNVKLDVLKIIIPLIIFSLATMNVFLYSNNFKGKENISLLFVILFGFFNGIGSSINIDLLISRHEVVLIPIVEAVIGFGAAVSILVLLLMTINLLLQKIGKLEKVKWIIGCTIIVFCISLQLVLKQIFQ